MSSKPGYTLLEMLISVTIFAGLLIIVLGALASSSSSMSRIGGLREKTEAARSIVDQITGDFRYIDDQVGVVDRYNGDQVFTGFYMTPESLVALLRYPTPNGNEFVRKNYTIKQTGGRLSLVVNERRDCEVQSGSNNLDCDQDASGDRDLVSPRYGLNSGTSVFRSFFGGLTPSQAASSLPKQNSYLELELTVKPLDYASLDCANSSIPAGTCYTLKTTLNAGLSR